MDLNKLRQPLGEPFFEDENCLLFQADCVEAMRELGRTMPGSIDLTVTSPPYNIGKEYESARPAGEYLDWSEEWIKALYDLIMA
jgi:adenine-specific DNA-methyltransferase